MCLNTFPIKLGMFLKVMYRSFFNTDAFIFLVKKALPV